MNANDIGFICIKIWFTFGLLFGYCEMGGQISSAFGEIEKEMYEMDWLFFPMKMQKMMLMVLRNAQQTTAFLGYGNFPANRETMKRVN